VKKATGSTPSHEVSISLSLFSVRRADIESFARELEAEARAMVTRRLCTIAGFYKTASKKNYWITRPPPLSGGRELITSHMPRRRTVTSSARCRRPPG
jgi:hypothetical protein